MQGAAHSAGGSFSIQLAGNPQRSRIKLHDGIELVYIIATDAVHIIKRQLFGVELTGGHRLLDFQEGSAGQQII